MSVRVLQVFRDHFSQVPGGIERHVAELAEGLSDRAEVAIVSGSRSFKPLELIEGKVSVHLVREYGRVVGAPLSPGFARRMRDRRFDVVHIHSPNPTAELVNLAPGRRPATVATYHADTARGGRMRSLYERAAVRSLLRCDSVIATTDAFVTTSSVLKRVHAISAGLIEVIPLGVDTARFSPAPHDRHDRPAIVLFVGRLRYYKGLTVLIEAMRSVDASLVIAGDGPERRRLEDVAKGLLGTRCRFLGHVPEVSLSDVYRGADVVCLPSTLPAEAFGLAAVEAMACGRPVVTTELGSGTSVVNRHGETGFVVPPSDPAALAEALRRVLAEPRLAARMGEAARRNVLEHYDRSLMLDRIFDLYERVLARSRRS